MKYVEIYSTTNPYYIAFIKSLFDAHNIDYDIEGENFLNIHSPAVPAKIKVDENKIKDAEELLEEFRRSHGEGTIK